MCLIKFFKTSIASLFILPMYSWAEAAPSSAPLSTGAMLSQVLLGLGVVTGVILLLAWLVKKMGAGAVLQQRCMRLIATMPVGTREKIVLVEVDNRRILLGVAQGNISSLHVFEENEELNLSHTENLTSLTSNNEQSDSKSTEKNAIEENFKWDFTKVFKHAINDGSRS